MRLTGHLRVRTHERPEAAEGRDEIGIRSIAGRIRNHQAPGDLAVTQPRSNDLAAANVEGTVCEQNRSLKTEPPCTRKTARKTGSATGKRAHAI